MNQHLCGGVPWTTLLYRGADPRHLLAPIVSSPKLTCTDTALRRQPTHHTDANTATLAGTCDCQLSFQFPHVSRHKSFSQSVCATQTPAPGYCNHPPLVLHPMSRAHADCSLPDQGAQCSSAHHHTIDQRARHQVLPGVGRTGRRGRDKE